METLFDTFSSLCLRTLGDSRTPGRSEILARTHKSFHVFHTEVLLLSHSESTISPVMHCDYYQRLT